MYTTDMDVAEYSNRLICGDSWAVTRSLPPSLVQCVVSSPPYFGHRIYSPDENTRAFEFGQEQEPAQYVDKLVLLFTALRSVLRDDGTVWLNLGDTYRNGQLLGIPWRTALALQDNGWFLRSEVIWHKPNAMPSSVKSRPTTAHEHLFLLSKQPEYLYNADAIREPHVTFSENTKMRGGRNHFGKRNSTPESGKNGGNHNLHDSRWDQAFHPLGRNKRTVWEVPLGKCREAHFAVFPPDLVETCILASTCPGQLVFDPFMGSGTVAVVAKSLDRDFLGIDLVPKYIDMAQRRVDATQRPLL